MKVKVRKRQQKSPSGATRLVAKSYQRMVRSWSKPPFVNTCGTTDPDTTAGQFPSHVIGGTGQLETDALTSSRPRYLSQHQ